MKLFKKIACTYKVTAFLKFVFRPKSSQKLGVSVSSGGSKGGARDAHPPGGRNSFNFMQFLGRFVKILGWCSIVEGWGPHLSEILDPPLCNSSASIGAIV